MNPIPPPLEPPLPETLDFKTLCEAILRQPHALILRIKTGGRSTLPRLIVISIIAFLLYGLVLGCFAKHQQLWAAPLKTVAGMLLACLICFPSLYIFSAFSGCKTTLAQTATYLACATTLAGLLLLGFAPAIWIFEESTDSLGFIGSLVIATWILTLWFAMRFLKQAMAATGSHKNGPIRLWCVVFLLVTLQLTTSLRPILGSSDNFLNPKKMFFLNHWFEQIDRSLPMTQPEP